MLEWKNTDEFQNLPGAETINENADLILWSRFTGPVIGKLWRFADGELFFIAPGYHGMKFTHYAEFSCPE